MEIYLAESSSKDQEKVRPVVESLPDSLHPRGGAETTVDGSHVTMNVLSTVLAAQREEILEAFKSIVQDQRKDAEQTIRTEIQETLELKLDGLQRKYQAEDRAQLSSNIQKFATGINNELNQRLSGYLQSIESHLESKIDRKADLLNTYITQRMELHFTQQLEDTRKMLKELFGGGSGGQEGKVGEEVTESEIHSAKDTQDSTIVDTKMDVVQAETPGGQPSGMAVDIDTGVAGDQESLANVDKSMSNLTNDSPMLVLETAEPSGNSVDLPEDTLLELSGESFLLYLIAPIN